MHCHKTLLEGFERSLMHKFIREELTTLLQRVKDNIRMYKTSRNNEMKDIINNEDIRYIMTKYQEFRRKLDLMS